MPAEPGTEGAKAFHTQKKWKREITPWRGSGKTAPGQNPTAPEWHYHGLETILQNSSIKPIAYSPETSPERPLKPRAQKRAFFTSRRAITPFFIPVECVPKALKPFTSPPKKPKCGVAQTLLFKIYYLFLQGINTLSIILFDFSSYICNAEKCAACAFRQT